MFSISAFFVPKRRKMMCQRGPPKIQIRNNAPKEDAFLCIKKGEEDMKNTISYRN